MQQLKTLKALGLLVGMIVGAGMFALPYSVSRAGFIWSGAHFLVTLSVVTVVHLLYARVFIEHGSRLRLPGYVRTYFGVTASRIALLFRLFSYYGYLLAYGVLGGLFLGHLMPESNPAYLSAVFFIVLSVFLFANLRSVGTINLVLTIPLVIFPFIILARAWSHLSFSAVGLYPQDGRWFLPYGIFLFAFSGASIIPEVVEILGRKNKRTLGRTIIAASLIVAVIYAVFIATVLGIARGPVAEDGLSVLKDFNGKSIFLLGTIIGLCALITSYLALGLELRFTFEYDLKWSMLQAWAATALVPPALYLLGVTNFVLILSIIGAIGVGVEGIFIALLAQRTAGTHRLLVGTLLLLFMLGAALGVLDATGSI